MLFPANVKFLLPGINELLRYKGKYTSSILKYEMARNRDVVKVNLALPPDFSVFYKYISYFMTLCVCYLEIVLRKSTQQFLRRYFLSLKPQTVLEPPLCHYTL